MRTSRLLLLMIRLNGGDCRGSKGYDVERWTRRDRRRKGLFLSAEGSVDDEELVVGMVAAEIFSFGGSVW